MSRATATRYLEELQARVYESLAPSLRAGLMRVRDFAADRARVSRAIEEHLSSLSLPDDEFRRRRERSLSRWEKAMASVPTVYEDPGNYGMIEEMIDSLEACAMAWGWPLPERPVFGSLPSGQVNAMAMRVPDANEHLVVFESQMFLFIMLLAKAVLRAFPRGGPAPEAASYLVDSRELDRTIEADPSVAERFADLLLNYVERGSPSGAEPYDLEPGHAPAMSRLQSSANLFVLGHEYGHIAAKHLDAALSSARMIQGAQAEALDYSWQQEYEADEIGVRLTLGTLRHRFGTDAPFAYWGADLVFSGMEAMDRATSLLSTGDENERTLGSHPPAASRRSALRKSLGRILAGSPDAGEGAAAVAVQLGSRLEYVVERLWQRVRPMLLRRRAEGSRPAATWGGAEYTARP